jgi:glycosyltransferase involved in cell wall biosynthesis
LQSSKQPLVSIITATLNSSLYIEQTIESVLSQSYKNIEYIIIDGKSNDGTLDIIKKYESLFDGRMKWFSGKDSGIYDAYNKGIKISSGQVIGIINSDDWYEENIIEDVVKNIGKYDMLHGKMLFVNREGETTKIYSHKKGKLKKYLSTPFNHPTMFVKKYVYENLGLYDSSFKTAGDYDFMLRFCNSAYDDVFLDKIIVNFRTVGITSSAKGVINPNEIKKALSNNGMIGVMSSMFVVIRKMRYGLYVICRNMPCVIKILRNILSYHERNHIT